MPLAYFITFTTYGTWLHGTDKGFGSVDEEHNVYGTPFLPPDRELEARERALMTQPDYYMDEGRRNVVRDALVEFAAEKGYTLRAAHARTNHVHVVITADRDPDRLMADLKARASRNLTRAGYENSERKRWTRDGSTKHLFTAKAVDDAVEYTVRGQGEPMAVYELKEPRTE